jgi:hypothetical protein
MKKISKPCITPKGFYQKPALYQLLLLLLTATLCFSQAPPKQWDFTYGGIFAEEGGTATGHLVLQTNDGGYIMGGSTTSTVSGAVTGLPRGGYDYWIVKTNSNGVKEWDARFGGADHDYLSVLRPTIDGGYMLGGTSYSHVSGDRTIPRHAGVDIWLVKIDNNGVKQWDQAFGSNSGGDILATLIQTGDGNFILGATFSGSGGDHTEGGFGGHDFWLVKMSSTGVKLWDKRYGGDGHDRMWDLIATEDGGYLLGGHSTSGISGTKTQDCRGTYDFWVVKVDNNGVMEWDARFGGIDEDYLYSLCSDGDGGYLLTGDSGSPISGDKTQNPWGGSGSDFWVVKINSSGVKQWDRRYGTYHQDRLTDVHSTSEGGYILAGYVPAVTNGDRTQTCLPIQNSQQWDIWLLKINSSGDTEWDAGYGGINQEIMGDIEPTNDGGYILGAYSASPASCDKSQSPVGDYDYWLVKLNCPGLQTWYADADGDGHGNLSISIAACSQPTGYVLNDDDCNDQNNQVYPGHAEICGNSIDDNCNGLIDENCCTPVTWYADNDGDGFGNASLTISACTQPTGYVANNTDCNDNNNLVNPGRPEICGNGIDDNCSGVIDEGCNICSGNKVLVCHRTNSNTNSWVQICVAPDAVSAHLAHGDYIGPCNTNRGETITEDSPIPNIEVSTKPGINIYPNPASSLLTIRNGMNRSLGLVSIIDVSGKIVYQKFIGNSQTVIDVKNLSAGVYYLRSDQFDAAIKFIKQ